MLLYLRCSSSFFLANVTTSFFLYFSLLYVTRCLCWFYSCLDHQLNFGMKSYFTFFNFLLFFFPIIIFLCILSTKYKSLLPDALTCHNYHFLDLFMSSWPCLNFEFIFIIFYLFFFAKISVKASLQRSQLSNASYFWEH